MPARDSRRFYLRHHCRGITVTISRDAGRPITLWPAARAAAVPEDRHDPTAPAIGTIGWTDLTVPDATAVSAFYASVAGWNVMPLSMGDYDDDVMTVPGGDDGVAGICHARGNNADLPATWMIYITVADLDASLAPCTAGGGSVLVEPRSSGGTAAYAVIRAPAGAAVALFDSGVRLAS